MLDMRLRLPELMAAHSPPVRTAYGLNKLSQGRLSMTTAQRLVDAAGHPDRVSLRVLGILCDAFRVKPCELLDHELPKN